MAASSIKCLKGVLSKLKDCCKDLEALRKETEKQIACASAARSKQA